MPDCISYIENIEKLSLLADGELPQSEAQELYAHIASCEECRRVYDAFMGISGAMSDDMADPPETLAAGIMYKISLQKKRGGSNTLRFAWGKYTALAAAVAVVIFAGSKLGLFTGGSAMSKAADAPAEAAALMDMATAEEASEPALFAAFSGAAADGAEMDSEPEAAAEPVPEPATGAAAPGNPAPGNAPDFEYSIKNTMGDGFSAGNPTVYCQEVSAPEDLALAFQSVILTGTESRRYEIYDGATLNIINAFLLTTESASVPRPEYSPDYTLTARDSDGETWTYYLWIDGDLIYWCDELATEAALSPMPAQDFINLL